MRCDTAPEVRSEPDSGFTLSSATPDDCDAIGAIYHACGFEPRSRETLREILASDHHAHAVTRHDGEIVAFTELETHLPNRVWVAYVGVSGEMRDRGIGSALVAWALARRFEAGATGAMLLLSPANRTALRAYEKVGFRRARLIDVLEKTL
jgi:ribosomal protein S18 acetylase RimI-like enzyme